MNKKEFLRDLSYGIDKLPNNIKKQYISYYSELIDDINENNESENYKIENINEIIDKILAENYTSIKMNDNMEKKFINLLAYSSILLGFIMIILSIIYIYYSNNSWYYYDIKEGGSVYGLLLIILGFEFKFIKHSLIKIFLFTLWGYIFITQSIRLLPDQIFYSHLMNSIIIFWLTYIIGIFIVIFYIIKFFKNSNKK